MTREQYEKLKEWVEAVTCAALSPHPVTRSYKEIKEKELDKLMGFGE